MTYSSNVGEEGYLDLLTKIMNDGNVKTDRTGVGTLSIFGAQLRFDLNAGFPLLTTKKLFAKGIFAELAWLIRGETNAFVLTSDNVHIWDEWANPKTGDLGPIYGKQWRKWQAPTHEIDQLRGALDLLRNQPDSRRIVVSAWNVSDLYAMALSPCHALFQFEVHDDKVSCHMYQRSADVFLGVPFNIASYAALTHVMAHLAKLDVGDLIVSFGDVHIYNNHFDQVTEQLSRKPNPFPVLSINPDLSSLDDVVWTDFRVTDYNPYPAIKAEVAV